MDNPRGNSPRASSLRSGSNPPLDRVENPESLLRPVPSSATIPTHEQAAPGPHTSSTGDVTVPPVVTTRPGPSTRPGLSATPVPSPIRNVPPSVEAVLPAPGPGLQRLGADLQPHLELWLEDLVQARVPPLVEDILNGLLPPLVEDMLPEVLPKDLSPLVLTSTADILESWTSPDGGNPAFRTLLREMVQNAVRYQFLKGLPGPSQPLSVNTAQLQQPLTLVGDGTAPLRPSGPVEPSGNRGALPLGYSPARNERAKDNNERAKAEPRRRSSRKKKRYDTDSDDQYGDKRRHRKDKRRHKYSDDSSSGSETDRYERRSDSEEERVHRHRSSNSTLEVIRPLNDVFKKAVDYRTYRLDRTGTKYPSSHRSIRYAKKSLDTQLTRVTFTGSDSIAVLGFLTRFRNACNHNGVSEGKAVWLFQYYLTGRALHLIQSRMVGNSLVVDDDEHTETLATYCKVVNFLLKTFATNEVIAAAYADLTSYLQSTGMSETEYGEKLWDKTIRCGSVISQNRLRSMYAEGVMSSIRAQVRNHLATHPRMTYDDLVRYAQALGDSNRAVRKTPQTVGFRKPDLLPQKPKRSIMSVDTEPAETFSYGEEDAHAVLALSTYAPSTQSLSSVTSTGSSSQSTPIGPTPPSSAPSLQGAQTPPRPTAQTGGRPMAFGTTSAVCWFCLSRDHTPAHCPMLPSTVRDKMLQQRNQNFRALNAQGLNPLTGKPRLPRPATNTTTVALAETGLYADVNVEPSAVLPEETPMSGTTYHTAVDPEQENA